MRKLPLVTDTALYVSLGDAQSRNTNGITGVASAFLARLAATAGSVKLVPLATDGGTAATVRYVQLPRLRAMSVTPAVVTLTLGATDLPRLASGDAEAVCRELREHTGAVLSALRAPVLLAALYDPMDGANPVLAQGVAAFNETLRDLSKAQDARVADVFAAFAGHGASVGDPLSPDANPADSNRYLCAGADLLPVPNAHGAAVFADMLLRVTSEAIPIRGA